MGTQTAVFLAQNRRWLSAMFIVMGIVSNQPAHADTIAPPQKVLIYIDGMTCGGCQTTVKTTLEHLDFVGSAHVSFPAGGACLELSDPGDSDRIRKAITDKTAYLVTSIKGVNSCPENLRPGKKADAWDDAEGLDVQVISRGEEVDLTSHLVENKFTIIDFGAPWCGPCHTTAKELKLYLAGHDDVAVRVVTLDAETSDKSYAMPVVEQHLKWASGIPYFLVYDSDGKRIYKGENTGKLIKTIDKKRDSK